VNKLLNFGGDPDHCLDTGIVSGFVISNRFARWRDCYRVTGKMSLAGSMHCPSAVDYGFCVTRNWTESHI